MKVSLDAEQLRELKELTGIDDARKALDYALRQLLEGIRTGRVTVPLQPLDSEESEADRWDEE